MSNDPNRRERSYAVRVEYPALTADTTIKAFKARVRTRVDLVRHVNPTGLVTDAANYFALSAKNGATTVADGLTTNSAGGAAFVANTWASMTNGALASRILAAGDDLDIFVDETGIQTLPAGAFLIHVTELPN